MNNNRWTQIRRVFDDAVNMAPAERARYLDVACDGVRDAGWGLLTQLTLPGGGKLGIYEPRHARPKAMNV